MGKEILPIPKSCCGERRKKNVFGFWFGATGDGYRSKQLGFGISGSCSDRRGRAGEERNGGDREKMGKKSGSLHLEEATMGGRRCTVCVCVCECSARVSMLVSLVVI
ncbi:LOW QUALITY PROTEIN: hypothetical protein PanWU01x14_357180 [Parasponia andersonii]|uniref:Uncharacterized protein n=1 Tax=Parasponia andersonii TaxID=3476 RepID=A0A2P5A8P0_PARAD|nr:LOW QUALITY PROTEIN: hypothetical protein PanWU01x14_357180 [Parasponia andersonii]